MGSEQVIRDFFKDSAKVVEAVGATQVENIVRASEIMAESFKSGGKLLLCGNGGSAADCQHVAAEFVSRLTKDFERPSMPAIALTTDTSFITAYANDCGFDGLFARQVEGLGVAGDVLIGISTSGSSKNVILALEVAKKKGLKTIALTGAGDKMKNLSDVWLAVPSNSTQFIQQAHLCIEHILCHLVERMVFEEKQ